LHALLLPLLDDEVSARIADPSLALECADAEVTLDGNRLDIGAPIPTTFALRWTMDRCQPLGDYLVGPENLRQPAQTLVLRGECQ